MEVPLCCWKKVNKSTERTVRQRGNIRETSSWDCVQNWNQIISNHSACSTTDLKDPKRVQSFFELQVCSPASGTSYLASPPKESKVGMRDPGSTPFVKPCKSGANRVAPEAGRHGKKHLEASMVGECCRAKKVRAEMRCIEVMRCAVGLSHVFECWSLKYQPDWLLDSLLIQIAAKDLAQRTMTPLTVWRGKSTSH